MASSVGVGIDVSKAKLDYATSDGALQGVLLRTPEGLLNLVRELEQLDVHRVVLEASGGYERLVLEVLHAAGLPVVLIQPMRARHFARALGRRAKTDAIDALVLARMARLAVDEHPLWRPPVRARPSSGPSWTVDDAPDAHRHGDQAQAWRSEVVLVGITETLSFLSQALRGRPADRGAASQDEELGPRRRS
ncbi:MAG: transposase [Alphaproteobacteria bacterium]|nr:transposase [Alphaproteobacteria bacterium]